MRLLALSGSLRTASTNTALLHVFARAAAPEVTVQVSAGLADLPAFNPDLEGDATPAAVLVFAAAVAAADGLVVACPEYAIPCPAPSRMRWIGWSRAPNWWANRSP